MTWRNKQPKNEQSEDALELEAETVGDLDVDDAELVRAGRCQAPNAAGVYVPTVQA